MHAAMRVALNADTTPLSISDRLIFKPFEARAREAAETGFGAINVDRSEAGLTPRKVRQIVDRYHLEVASGFFQGRFYRAAEEEEIFCQAAQQAEFSAALGQDCLFVSAFVSPPERHALAGRIRPGEAVSLDAGQFIRMARLLERIAALWQGYGIELCFHPHVATYVEAPHEIDRLMEATDPGLVKLGVDTGHIFFGGGDPVGMIERYYERLAALHVKDIRSQVVEEARSKSLDYRQACARGVWTELGRGDIGFPSLFALLRNKGWSGWVIVETDHTALATAAESSRMSREYLHNVIGI